MHNYNTVFSQLIKFLKLHQFHKSIRRYDGDYRVRTFSCLDQFLCMAFAQLTYRESLREIEACLREIADAHGFQLSGASETGERPLFPEAEIAAHSAQIFMITDIVMTLAHVVEDQGRHVEKGFARLTRALKNRRTGAAE
jgi:hypothetical protein